MTDLVVVPGPFFIADVIHAHKPLGPNARRAGWQGCNILIGRRAAYRSRRGRSLLEACPCRDVSADLIPLPTGEGRWT